MGNRLFVSALLALDLLWSEKLKVALKSNNLGRIVYQPSSEISHSVGLLSLKNNNSLGLVRILVTIESEARKRHIDRCSYSDTLDLQKK